MEELQPIFVPVLGGGINPNFIIRWFEADANVVVVYNSGDQEVQRTIDGEDAARALVFLRSRTA
jgi:hypothetical protein